MSHGVPFTFSYSPATRSRGCKGSSLYLGNRKPVGVCPHDTVNHKNASIGLAFLEPRKIRAVSLTIAFLV